MRSRFSIWRFNYRDIQRKANRRLGKSPDEGKFRLADLFFLAAFFMMSFDVPFNKVEFLAGVEHITELRIILAVVLYIVGLVLVYRRMAPRPCWTKASWATSLTAVVWTVLPWILFWTDDFDFETARNISVMSVLMWVIFLGCLLRLRYIRRRSRETITLMRMRNKRQRSYNLL